MRVSSKQLPPHEAALTDALAARAKFSITASRVVEELRAMPERVGLRHRMVDDLIEEFHLVRGVWVMGAGGCKLMLLDEKKNCNGCDDCSEITCGICALCTRVLCEADKPIRMPAHRHDYAEVVTPISGYLIEHRGHGNRIPTDKIFYPAHEVHEPEVFGLHLICWSPPLLPSK